MDNQPSFDRSLIIPIVVGGLSVLGIIVVLLIGSFLNSPAAVAVTSSATPFQYVYLGTEPLITTPLTAGSVIAPLTDEQTDPFPIEATPIQTTSIRATPIAATPIRTTSIFATRPSVSTALILSTITSSNNPVLLTSTPGGVPTSSTAAAPNTYDDTDTRLEYRGNWISQTNVSGAYLGTLHRSDTTDDSVTFTFTGQEIHLFYQAGPSLGSITITIDGIGPPPLSQAQTVTQNKEWVPSEPLSDGTHIIVITHSGGGSVNIDSLLVPAATVTPTRTPTPTP